MVYIVVFSHNVHIHIVNVFYFPSSGVYFYFKCGVHTTTSKWIHFIAFVFTYKDGMYWAHSHGICSTFSSQYPTSYTPPHPRPPLLIASVINMSKKTQCPYCLRMFNSEQLMRHFLQCSVRMTMANNNILNQKLPLPPNLLGMIPPSPSK